MITLFTVFTIFTGMASLLGFAYIFFGGRTAAYKRLCALGLGVASIWSGYVTLIPDSATARNVASKVKYYRIPTGPTAKNLVLVQSGEFTTSGCEIEVEFPVPFREPPEVEMVNIKGDTGFGLGLASATQFKVTFKSAGAGPCIPHRERTYRWVAKGTPIGELAH